MELLNNVLTEVTGRPHRLHVCELPNLGVFHLASFLRRRSLSVGVVNFFNDDKETLVEMLAQSPRAVAITMTFYTDNQPIIDIIEFIRRYNSETKIIVGGPHVYNLCSAYDTATLDFIFRTIGADFYINDSQGELTLARVVKALGEGDDVTKIPNLYLSFDGRHFQAAGREVEDNDMDENHVRWDLFDNSAYAPTAQMRTARSCAFNCAFCRYPIVAGPLNLTSLEVIQSELRTLHDSGVRNVVFIDDTFNVPLPRFKDICRMMLSNGFDFNWFSYFRCSNADDEAFDLMQRSGCKGVFLGVESGDCHLLPSILTRSGVKRRAASGFAD